MIPIDVPEGVRLRERVPGFRLEDGSVGAKLDRSGGKLDASIAYYYGFNLLPEARVGSAMQDPLTGARRIDVSLVHPRRHMVGADFATAAGRFGYRGEVAYVHTGNASGHDVEEVTPYLYYVLGIERSFFDNLNVIVQYVGRYVVNRVDPARALDDPDPLRGQARFLAARETFVINQQLDTVQKWLVGPHRQTVVERYARRRAAVATLRRAQRLLPAAEDRVRARGRLACDRRWRDLPRTEALVLRPHRAQHRRLRGADVQLLSGVAVAAISTAPWRRRRAV